MKNRQWLLKRHPVGQLAQSDFEYREGVAPTADDLLPGQLLLRNRMFMCAPTMRNWMEPHGTSLYPSMKPGAVVMAPAVGEVVASSQPAIAIGSRIIAFSGWQDYQIIGADGVISVIPDGVDYQQIMGPYGLNARTAYFGLTKIGKPVNGDVLVVSGAAGSTGSVAAQIGKILECRVIGIAGGSAKCAWLLDDCRLDAVIDYRREDVAERLSALCPDGIDIFFDNVGGEILQAAIANMARLGRIVLCGQIAGYDSEDGAPAVDMMRLIYGSVTMQGFLNSDYDSGAGVAPDQLRQWVDAGLIRHREDVRTGFAKIPHTFMALFSGGNDGTLLAAIE